MTVLAGFLMVWLAGVAMGGGACALIRDWRRK